MNFFRYVFLIKFGAVHCLYTTNFRPVLREENQLLRNTLFFWFEF